MSRYVSHDMILVGPEVSGSLQSCGRCRTMVGTPGTDSSDRRTLFRHSLSVPFKDEYDKNIREPKYKNTVRHNII